MSNDNLFDLMQTSMRKMNNQVKFDVIKVNKLPIPSEKTMNKIYLLNCGAGIYKEFITVLKIGIENKYEFNEISSGKSFNDILNGTLTKIKPFNCLNCGGNQYTKLPSGMLKCSFCGTEFYEELIYG